MKGSFLSALFIIQIILNMVIVLANAPPSLETVILNATTSLNRTNENLTAYVFNITDSDNDSVTINYDWRLNGSSIAVLNLPMTAPFNNGSRNLTFDFSSYNNVGVMNGTSAPTWTSLGKYGGAYTFNGGKEIVSANNVGISGAQVRTITAWANITSCTDPGGIAGWGDTATDGRIFYLTCSLANDFQFGVWGYNADTSSSTNSRDGVWHFLAASYDGATVRLYIDGVLSVSAAKSLNTFNHQLRIGKETALGSSITGQIDEVQVYNRTLSAEQIKAIYNASAPRYNRLVDAETSTGDNWTVKATPIDSQGLNGTGKLSNNLVILSPVCV